MATPKLKKENGIVYTKPVVVDLILDIVGYTSDKELWNMRLLDPSYGEGAFLEVVVKRLLKALPEKDNNLKKIKDKLKKCIIGIEVNKENYHLGRERIRKVLKEFGFCKDDIDDLLNNWLIQEDFLLWKPNDNNIKGFDFIVGNPPYVRQELIEDNLIKKYRKLYSTIYDRADLYVPFIEHGLELLNSNGKLSFICSDRFTKNRYGKKLRKFIVNNYKIKYFIDMHKTNPFEEKVSVYPCIFVISSETYETEDTRTAILDSVSKEDCSKVKDYLLRGKTFDNSQSIKTHTFSNWFKSDEPWIINSEEVITLLRKIEEKFVQLEDDRHGIKVGIGVATGANDIYIINPSEVEIENEVLLPTISSREVSSGKIKWSGKYLINPYSKDGGLINLEQFPNLKKYFNLHKERILNRSVAKRSPKEKWFRTIDRIYQEVYNASKLLIPDIKGDNCIVKDNGDYYPRNNLYYMLPGNWDIDVLHSIMKSSIIKFFIWCYAVKMRGKYLRYQAQYLRKIHLPIFSNISNEEIKKLKSEHVKNNLKELDSVVASVFDLSSKELKTIRDLVV
ncbi:Eco57I restriction-modification methylase domain-containing protein [Natroniella acetigena]|uniref:Eco57I restriction-modification methylase domain-containing protein n=1 Tax=Natroniella acetigena TaxID=52004 RepID=UPI00200B113B|nr:N-6 DNA methylase [Natroniella acetigena]MCK8828574.1 Eco57I restriction-modification methylase domain-containing protein [Natroniella acetigena]